MEFLPILRSVVSGFEVWHDFEGSVEDLLVLTVGDFDVVGSQRWAVGDGVISRDQPFGDASTAGDHGVFGRAVATLPRDLEDHFFADIQSVNAEQNTTIFAAVAVGDEVLNSYALGVDVQFWLGDVRIFGIAWIFRVSWILWLRWFFRIGGLFVVTGGQRE